MIFVILPSQVAVARSRVASYARLAESVPAPELPSGRVDTVAQLAVRDLFLTWGLDGARAGSPAWNPLGELIPPGSRVVVKPNWVHHSNRKGSGLDCLITHPSIIAAVLEYVALARPSAVVLGDAPVQGCDFAALRSACALDQLVERFRARGMNLTLADFRRTVMTGPLGRPKLTRVRPDASYVSFDLGSHSLLEPISGDAPKFRATLYNPADMARAHAPGRHCYLIAREVMEADVFINLAKLKSHQKAGLTAGLKNPVGMNGAKEQLPHHRLGGSGEGGDCYPGRSFWKRQAERLLDAANRASEGPVAKWCGRLAELSLRMEDDRNLDGAWRGNDTVWRMSLDLQRILRYGRPDGSLAGEPQRRVITITDGIIGGQGDGPLYPDPAPAGVVTGALNDAAADWVHARLMGWDPLKVPIVREAFGGFQWPIAHFAPDRIRVRMDGREMIAADVFPVNGCVFEPARGWRGHCEMEVTACSRA